MIEPVNANGSGRTPVIDAAQLRERQERSRQRIAEVQARAQQAKATLAAETSTATSSDRSVTVTVNAAGTLIDLSFASSANKLSLNTIANTVLTTYRHATAEAVQQTAAVMRELVGEDAPVLDIIRASVAELQDES